MKKVLLLSLSLIMGFSAFAQRQVMKNDVRMGTASAKKELAGKEITVATESTYTPQTPKSVVINRYDDMEDGDATIISTYDLQSNGYVANRIIQFPDGTVATTATMSHEENQTASDRGTGYNFYDGSDWLEAPETRVESFKTGWPSIAPWGESGEILLCHGNAHMQCFVREVAGEGDWTYVGALPDYPEGYIYNEYPTWPRVVTCGDNHDIVVAVACLQHSISTDETDLQTVMWRSDNATDLSSWEISYGPLHETGWDHNEFSADDYCMASNGHTVALLYVGCLTNSAWMFKSTDDGLTWTTTKVWENPYEGRSFEYEDGQPWGMEDTLFMPMNGSIAVDCNGVVHVAMNTFEMIHTTENESGYYSYYYGRAVDGILYWNDTQEAPIADTEHPEYTDPHFANPNPHHAARLWWPIPDEPGYVHMVADSTKWIGFIPMYEGISWSNDLLYHENDYYYRFYGTSGHPALSCDPLGNLACAFSSPCTNRASGGYYHRSIYVSYRDAEEGYWQQVEDDLMDDFAWQDSDGLFTCGAPNTANLGEFWFSYQQDDAVGLYWGSGATQTDATQNYIHGVKIIKPMWDGVEESSEAQEVVYNIYPNPVTDNMMTVYSAQAADATITIVNLVGQTVKQFNKNLVLGANSISVDLKSGVYFCTISANGFDKTVKFIVK